MLILLFAILIFLTCLVYKLYNNDLLTPAIWLLLGWDLSVALAFVKFQTWGDISEKTVVVILIGIVSYLMGSFLGHFITIKDKKTTCCFSEGVYLNLQFLVLSLAVMLYTLYVDYDFVKDAAFLGGFIGGDNFLSYARDSMLTEVKMPYSIYIPIALSQALAYFITHSLIDQLINKRNNQYILIKLLCIVAFLLISLLSTGRTMFMHYLLFVLADASILLTMKYGRSQKINNRIIKYGVGSVVTIGFFFVIVEMFFRASKYGIERNMIDQIVIYSSSGIYALNNFLNFPTSPVDNGYETMYNIFSVIKRLGFEVDMGDHALAFTTFAGVKTNVYTALRRYIHDFGYGGMVAIQFAMGMIYQFFYKEIISNKSNLLLYMMYCSFIFAPVFNSVEERFIVNVLSLRSGMIFVFTIVLIKIATRWKNYNR